MDYEVLVNNRLWANEKNIAMPLDFQSVDAFRKKQEGYDFTPLHSWKKYAESHGIKDVLIKDEAHRFGLNAFKGLGVSYAIQRIEKAGDVYVSCTDGNHGKALAWYGQKTGHKVIIFMPCGSTGERVEAIKKYGADVTVTDMNYDDTVRFAKKYADENGYILVQDTALEDYTVIPSDIVMGYSTIISEVLNQTDERITHIFVQAGVGSLAGGVIWSALHLTDDMPYIGVIESSACPCIFESIRQKKIYRIGGEPKTVMAGLNCGEPNPVTLPIIQKYSDWLIQCDDAVCKRGMEMALHPRNEDISFSSGECGAVSLGFLDEALNNNRELFKFDENSVVLLINTEGRLEEQ